MILKGMISITLSENWSEKHLPVGVFPYDLSLSLHTKGAKNKYGGKMIQVSGPLIWNSIPIEIHKSTSIHIFKTQLKKYLIEQYNN